MKSKFQVLMIFFLHVLLLFSYSTSARFLTPKQGEERVNAIGSCHAHASSFVEINQQEDLSDDDLMGSLEKCEEKDEECFKRRMVAEAHLDYIYTQHHKP